MIEIENLCKRYGEKLAAGGLGFAVRPGVVTGFPRPGRGRPARHDADDRRPGCAHRGPGAGQRPG
jgi:hypothetical protein